MGQVYEGVYGVSGYAPGATGQPFRLVIGGENYAAFETLDGAVATFARLAVSGDGRAQLADLGAAPRTAQCGRGVLGEYALGWTADCGSLYLKAVRDTCPRRGGTLRDGDAAIELRRVRDCAAPDACTALGAGWVSRAENGAVIVHGEFTAIERTADGSVYFHSVEVSCFFVVVFERFDDV